MRVAAGVPGTRRPRPRHGRFQRVDADRSDISSRLQHPRHRLVHRASSTAPSRTLTRRSSSIRNMRSPTPTAASPWSPRATSTAPSRTSTRRSSSIRKCRSVLRRGIAWKAKGDFDRAIADFDQAIELDPKYCSAYFNRGIAWASKGDFDRAIADYDQAIRLDPKNAKAYYNRGIAWEKKRSLQAAFAHFKMHAQLAPSDPRPYGCEARIQTLERRYRAALHPRRHSPPPRTARSATMAAPDCWISGTINRKGSRR